MHNKLQDANAEFWKYLSQTQKDLILQGDYLINDVIKHGNYTFKDYSFVIFPYAKAYEGYPKQLFLDLKFISHLDCISDHLRLGKLLSPFLIERLGDRSLYKRIQIATSTQLADKLWDTWKTGRNQIFHYFPHNVKAVSFAEAESIIDQIIQTMVAAFIQLKSQGLQPGSHEKE